MLGVGGRYSADCNIHFIKQDLGDSRKSLYSYSSLTTSHIFKPQSARASFSIWPCQSRETVCTQDKKSEIRISTIQVMNWFQSSNTVNLVMIIVWNKEFLFFTNYKSTACIWYNKREKEEKNSSRKMQITCNSFIYR